MERADRRTNIRYTFRREVFMQVLPHAINHFNKKNIGFRNIFFINKRLYLNYYFSNPYPCLDKKDIENRVLDLGKEGIFFISPYLYSEGETLIFYFRTLNMASNIKRVKGKVVWTKNDNNLFSIGVNIRPNHKWCNLIKGLEQKGMIIKKNNSRKQGKSVNKKPSFEEILKWLGAKDWYTRYNAIINLKQVDNFDNKFQLLINAIKDPDYRVRIAAINVLSELHFTSAVPFIGYLLLKDKNWLVRESAAISLGKFDKETALKFLLAGLKDQDTYVKLSVIDALRNLKDITAVAHLNLLMNNQDVRIHRLVSETIKEINNI